MYTHGDDPSDEPLLTYASPTHIPGAKAKKHVWGDKTSGFVFDRTFVSSFLITHLIFSLPGGGAFRHSEQFQTIFAADELYYVLSGVLILANPKTGEVHRLDAHDSAFFQRDTWHHGFGHSPQSLEVLEFFSPPPVHGTGAAYARRQPPLHTPRYTRDPLLGQWSSSTPEAIQSALHIVRHKDVLWRLQGMAHPVLMGIYASTSYLTAGELRLMPGQGSDPHLFDGEITYYVLTGNVLVYSEAEGLAFSYELEPGDAMYIPRKTRHRFQNLAESPVRLLFGTAHDHEKNHSSAL